jgi:hypothetical protein
VTPLADAKQRIMNLAPASEKKSETARRPQEANAHRSDPKLIEFVRALAPPWRLIAKLPRRLFVNSGIISLFSNENPVLKHETAEGLL